MNERNSPCAIDAIRDCLGQRRSFILRGGAGSGKTQTLVDAVRMAHQIEPMASVACITYTNNAAQEIMTRVDSPDVVASTIHSFLWNLISPFQADLVRDFKTYLMAKWAHSLSDDDKKSLNDVKVIRYEDYPDLPQGIISHNELLALSLAMFTRHSLLMDCFLAKYQFLFIDEYQDADENVISLFLDCILPYAQEEGSDKPKLCIGLFGDPMQSIYNKGITDIDSGRRFAGNFAEIWKPDNYRSSSEVIQVINNIRADGKLQRPSGKVRHGIVTFLHGPQATFSGAHMASFTVARDLPRWADRTANSDANWKILSLTHRQVANIAGYEEFRSAFSNNNRLYGQSVDGDNLVLALRKLGGILHHYREKKYSRILDQVTPNAIRSFADKKRLIGLLDQTVDDCTTIDMAFNLLSESNLFFSASLIDQLRQKSKAFSRICGLQAVNLIPYYEECVNLTSFETMHGCKGLEYDNVCVVLDDTWNMYSFANYLAGKGKDTVRERTARLFYVACSRARKNLVVLYPDSELDVIAGAKKIFGDDNVLDASLFV